MAAAFGALGPAPSHRELALVADALRSSGDPETIALWDGPSTAMVTGGSLSLRKEAGAGVFVALDLYC